MSTNPDMQTLEETLNKTDLGHIINENKTAIICIGALIIFGIIAYAVFDQVNSTKRYAELDQIFTLEQEVFRPFIDDKSESQEFIGALKNINSDFKADPNLIPVFIESINKLDQAGKITPELLTIADTWLGLIKKSNSLYIFLAIRIAALREDALEADAAIKLLESLVAHKSNILKDKIHFDLGRLYLKKNDKKTAKERFDYIVKNYKDSEYIKLSELYMSGL